jgi:hypothetical protein
MPINNEREPELDQLESDPAIEQLYDDMTRQFPPGIPQRASVKRKLAEMIGKGKDDEDTDVCNYCNLQFRDHNGVQRHLYERKCTDFVDDDEEEDELSSEKPKMAVSEKPKMAAILEEDGFRYMLKQIRASNEDYLFEKRRSYEDKNLSRDWIDRKMLNIVWRSFKKSFTGFIKYFRYFKDGPKTAEILRDAEDEDEIAKKLVQYKPWISKLMEDDSDDESDNSDDDDSDVDESDQTVESDEG